MMNLKPYKTPRMTPSEYKAYFLEHVTPIFGRANFYTVKKDLKVFKSIHCTAPRNSSRYMNKAIASLLIKKGSVIHAKLEYLNDTANRKCRADSAYIQKMYDFYDDKEITVGFSGWDSSFRYNTGKTVRPVGGFSYRPFICETGIHFFLQLQDALNY